jgi:hypothetical protein
LGTFETPKGVYVNSGRLRERLLAQFPRAAAVPNLLTKRFKDGS